LRKHFWTRLVAMVETDENVVTLGDELTGTIISKRRLGGGLIFLMIRPLHSGGDVLGDVQLMLPPEIWQTQMGMLALLRPGSVARFVTNSSASGPFVDKIARTAVLLRVKAERTAVERVVETVCTSSILSCEEASAALGCDLEDLQELMELWQVREKCTMHKAGQQQQQTAARDPKSDDSKDLKNSQEAFKVAVLVRCRILQGLPAVRQGRQRGPHLRRSDLVVLEAAEAADEAQLCTAQLVEHLPPDALVACNVADAGVDELLAGHGSCDVLGDAHPMLNLVEPDRKSRRGPQLLRDYAHEKKAPQVIWFISQLRTIIEALPPQTCVGDIGSENVGSIKHGQLPLIHVLDIGGGRGDLAICVATVFRDRCHVTVVDCNSQSLSQGRERASALGLDEGMSWLNCGINDLRPEQLQHVDVVLGLHACGGLTDAILSLTWQLQALRDARKPPVSFLICPCCFSKNLDLLPASSWASERPQSQVEVLTRLAESDERSVSLRAMLLINSARLAATSTALGLSQMRTATLELKLLAFPERLSRRNLVLQGCNTICRSDE